MSAELTSKECLLLYACLESICKTDMLNTIDPGWYKIMQKLYDGIDVADIPTKEFSK